MNVAVMETMLWLSDVVVISDVAVGVKWTKPNYDIERFMICLSVCRYPNLSE